MFSSRPLKPIDVPKTEQSSNLDRRVSKILDSIRLKNNYNINTKNSNSNLNITDYRSYDKSESKDIDSSSRCKKSIERDGMNSTFEHSTA